MKASIEKTKDVLDTAIDNRDNLLNNAVVDWKKLGDTYDEIESLQIGLERLKEWRSIYFPNWQDILVED